MKRLSRDSKHSKIAANREHKNLTTKDLANKNKESTWVYSNNDNKDNREEEYRSNNIIRFKPLNATQRHILRAIKANDITLLEGPAGSAKSLMSIYSSYLLLKDTDSPVQKIVIIRLAAETCGEKIGALPGELEDKLGHLAAPIVDNLSLFMSKGEIEYLLDKGYIEVVPVSHARGRSFNNCAIIVEECQNLDYHMLLTIITRLGSNSKMIINGDPLQIDIVGRDGIRDAKKLLLGLPGVAYAKLTTADIERHPLVKAVLERVNKNTNPGATEIHHDDKIDYFTNGYVYYDDEPQSLSSYS